ncbi:MAG: PAS domain S-box protein, partial [Bacteroidales bacterium]|nr:PAS domain S-box protein [Bacteroidales bacterium]
ENVYRNFVEVLPDGVYKSTEEGSFIDVNQAMVDILGYDNKAELMAVDIKKQLYFDEIDRESVVLKQDMKEMGVYRMKRKDGSEIWVEDHGWLTHDKDINILYHEGIMRDVTERIKAEIDILKAKEKAEESEIRFKALHNASFGGIAIHDKGIILECNQGLSDVSGFTIDQLIGMDGLLLIAEDSREVVMKNILAQYEKDYEVVGLRKDGEEYPLRLEARNIPYKGNEVRVVEFRDITEAKKAEIEIMKALEKAKESDRLKTAFLSNMSHEIRTPMNGILGFSNLLKEPDLTGDEQKKYIEIIERSGNRMLNTINDIIDISKVESGQMEVAISEVNVNQQLDYLHIFFAPEAENKDIQLNYVTGLPLEESLIKTDREKLYSILTNLIKNAVKYTHEGRIEFGYVLRDSNKLEFYVKDTGIGIPKDRQKAIFDRFVQADIEDAQVYEGSGLGLAISAAYVEMLGGKLWVDSVEKKGSTFYFTLPYQIEN